MAAFEPRRKAQTYGKVQRGRQAQFISQDRFYDQTTKNDRYDLLDDGSTAESARKRAKRTPDGFSREGSRDSESVHSDVEVVIERSDQIPVNNLSNRHQFNQTLTPFTASSVRRANASTKPLPVDIVDLSDTADVFDVPDSSGDEAKAKLKITRKPAPVKRKLNAVPKAEPPKARGSKSVKNVTVVNLGVQPQPQTSHTPHIAAPPKTLASRKKERKTPPPQPRAKLGSPLRSASITSFGSVSPAPQTPQKTPRPANMNAVVAASPGLLSLQSLDLRSPQRRTPKTSRKTTPLESSPEHMSTGSSIADVLDFSESLLSGKRSASPDVEDTPRKRMSLDLPDLATPKRKKRLIDVLANEVDQSPRKHESTEESESGSESDEEETIVAPLSYVRPKNVPILEEDDMVLDSQETVSRRQGPMNANTGRPRITYASQRSYLAEELDLSMPLTDTPLIPELQGLLESSQSKSRNAASAFDMPDTDGLPTTSAIKSIHELRQAGSNKRSQEEMEALMEDIEAHGNTSRRRIGLLSAAQKFGTTGFPERFVELGFDSRLAEGLAEQDMLSICALSFITACLLRVDSSCFHNYDVLAKVNAMAGSLLEENRTLALIGRDRKTNMSKYGQNVLTDFVSSVKKAAVWTAKEDGIVTPRMIALIAIHAISQTGLGPDILIHPSAEPTVRSLLALLPQVGEKFTHSAVPVNERASLDLLLSILNPYVTRTASYGDSSIWTSDIYGYLGNFLPATFSWTFAEAAGMQMQVLTFYLNLSHENRVLCDKLAHSTFLSSLIRHTGKSFETLDKATTEDEQEAVLQPLIIVLAILINTAESSESAKLAVAAENDPQAGFDALVKVFLTRQEGIAKANSIEKSKANVALGYVSVLLAILSEVPELCRQLKARIPGQKLGPLIETLRQFNEVHQKVDQAGGESGTSGKQDDGQVERMQAAMKRLSEV